MTESDFVVARLDPACGLLAECTSAPEAKRIADIGHAAEVYARRQKLGQSAIKRAHAVVIDAQTLMGEFLKRAEKNKGMAGSKVTGALREPLKDATPTLASAGLSKKESSNAQLLADLKAKAPETHAEVRNGAKTVTAARRELKLATVAASPTLPSGKFRVLYADPSWKYSDQLTESYGPTEFHYPAMSHEELCSMPIRNLAENDAVLFLWVTSPMLAACFGVVNAWGYTYKSGFVWDKVKHNMGHYNSVRHELLLICTRGSCLPDNPKLFDNSVQSIERSKKHSEKPEEFRQIIETLYPHGRRLELFARQPAKGWEVYGNEC